MEAEREPKRTARKWKISTPDRTSVRISVIVLKPGEQREIVRALNRLVETLHGNATLNVTACRVVPLHAGVKLDCAALGLQETALDGTARKPNACKPLAERVC